MALSLIASGATDGQGLTYDGASGLWVPTLLVKDTDSRLSDARTPTGAAAGDLTGTYPNPTIAANVVTAAKASTGTGATNLCIGNDARLSDTRTPTNGSVGITQTGTGTAGLAAHSFAAYRNAALSLTTGSVVTFDTEDFDVSSEHDTTTNKGRFTPLIAGYYFLTAHIVGGTLGSATQYFRLWINKNGANHKELGLWVGNVGSVAARTGGAAVVVANGSTDYFEIAVEHTFGSALALSVGATLCYWGGQLIGKS